MGKHQLKVWQGQFGREYTHRNVIDWRKRVDAFQEMLAELPIKRILEVGCNRGHNLLALAEIMPDGCEIVGIEPNQFALELARAASVKVGVLHADAFDLPFKDTYFDLVFTAGVLIHIPLSDLPLATAEIYRVAKRYLLAVEYYAEQEEVINYRGSNDLLWKRDFLKHYQKAFPGLTLIRNGYWDTEQGFDKTHWWLFEKAG